MLFQNLFTYFLVAWVFFLLSKINNRGLKLLVIKHSLRRERFKLSNKPVRLVILSGLRKSNWKESQQLPRYDSKQETTWKEKKKLKWTSQKYRKFTNLLQFAISRNFQIIFFFLKCSLKLFWCTIKNTKRITV